MDAPPAPSIRLVSAWTLRLRPGMLAVLTLPVLMALVGLSSAARAADVIDWGYCPATAQPYGWHLREERPQVVAAAAALPLPVAALHTVDLPFLKVTIRDAEGDALAGTLDFVHSQVRWRGASPWIPGATYTCTIEADNSGLAAEQGSSSALDDWTVTWDFTAVDGPATTVPVDAIEPAATYQRVELVVSGPWVCCDGAYPIVSGHGHDLCDVETCGSLRALGKIVVDVGFAASAAPAAITNSVVYPRNPREEGDAWCVDVEVHDVTTGSLAATGSRCVPRPPGPLGILEHDPTARLETICEGELYTCGTYNESDQGEAWNPDDCTPWMGPGGDATSGAVTAGVDEPSGDEAASDTGGAGVGADKGCTCRGGGPLGAPSFGLGLLLALLVRRRPRRHRYAHGPLALLFTALLAAGSACHDTAGDPDSATATTIADSTSVSATAPTTDADETTGSSTDGCPVDPCDVTEYCDWGANSCGAGASTSGDETSGDEPRCEPRPAARACGAGESPVCGCDGQVHASECHAAAVGVDVDASGGCTPPPETFACGYRLCDPGVTYCRIILVDGESAPDIYDCSALPPGCGDTPSCACILEAEACPWTECYDEGHHFQTTCPQG